jgi:hypothetical protein
VIVETFFVDGVGVLHDQRTPLGNHLLLVSGMTGAIKSYTQQNSGWYKQLGPDVAIKKFMDLEIASKENAAGPPASILKMDAEGVRWIERLPKIPVTRRHLAVPIKVTLHTQKNVKSGQNPRRAP